MFFFFFHRFKPKFTWWFSRFRETLAQSMIGLTMTRLNCYYCLCFGGRLVLCIYIYWVWMKMCWRILMIVCALAHFVALNLIFSLVVLNRSHSQPLVLTHVECPSPYNLCKLAWGTEIDRKQPVETKQQFETFKMSNWSKITYRFPHRLSQIVNCSTNVSQIPAVPVSINKIPKTIKQMQFLKKANWWMFIFIFVFILFFHVEKLDKKKKVQLTEYMPIM